MSADVTIFGRQLSCAYGGEHYSVRDNGAVLRHARPGKRVRPADEKWTFGTPNAATGYMEIVTVRVHRIVATAFHGNPPTAAHVVDHIDTNRRNNRPENLRWVTRLENVLLNPITARRIIYLYGSIEEFLADPSKPRVIGSEPNFDWMRTVSLDEAQASYRRLLCWANSDKAPSGGSLGDWVFNRNTAAPLPEQAADMQPVLVMAQTPGATQRNWRVPSFFPNCPSINGELPLKRYAANLPVGAIFAHNQFSESFVFALALSKDGNALWVMCTHGENSVKKWSLAEVTYEDGSFVHTSRRTYYTQEGAEKEFTLAQGLVWSGGDSIDDYC